MADTADNYTVRLIRAGEAKLLQDYLDSYWRKDHIFVHDKALLDWQHLNGDSYNFVGLFDRSESELLGCMGFLGRGHFTQGRILPGEDIWGVIWHVDKARVTARGMGMKLIQYILDAHAPSPYVAIGINDQIAGLYEHLGYRLGTLGQCYLRNPAIEASALAPTALAHDPTAHPATGATRFEPLNTQDQAWRDLATTLAEPHKSADYLAGRYLSHPRYSYQFWRVVQGQVQSLWVLRECSAHGVSCLRVVDMLNPTGLNPPLAGDLAQYLSQSKVEYLDIMSDPVRQEHFIHLGFTPNTDAYYVPHHFEPFEQQRVQVRYATAYQQEALIFKGDSDLDRPGATE